MIGTDMDIVYTPQLIDEAIHIPFWLRVSAEYTHIKGPIMAEKAITKEAHINIAVMSINKVDTPSSPSLSYIWNIIQFDVHIMIHPMRRRGFLIKYFIIKIAPIETSKYKIERMNLKFIKGVSYTIWKKNAKENMKLIPDKCW